MKKRLQLMKEFVKFASVLSFLLFTQVADAKSQMY